MTGHGDINEKIPELRKVKALGNQSKVRCAYCTRFLECYEPDTETQHLDLIHCDSYQEVEALQNQSSTTKDEK